MVNGVDKEPTQVDVRWQMNKSFQQDGGRQLNQMLGMG